MAQPGRRYRNKPITGGAFSAAAGLSPYPNTVFVAPTTRGTGDGSSAANAHRFNGSAVDTAWLQGVLTSWVADLVADPSDVGINQAHTINTVKPGFEVDYFDADDTGALTAPVKAYVTDARHGVWVRRVCFLSDVGEYQITTDSWCVLDKTHGLAAPTDIDAGTNPTAPVRRIHFVAYRSSDGKRSDQVAGGTETRSVTIPAKDPTANWASASNYTTDSGGRQLWSGPTVTTTKTWTVRLPSPIRAVIRGNRTADPRTGDKHSQQWNVSTLWSSDFLLRDPTSNAVEPGISNGAGGFLTFKSGQVYDPAVGVIAGSASVVKGPTAFQSGMSCMGFQGFEFCAVERPFGGSYSFRFVSFLDCRFDNTRYAMWRWDNRTDIEIARWHGTSISQKVLAPGKHNQRWHISDIYMDGQLAVADRIQSLIGAANSETDDASAYNAGAFRYENLIIEYMWDANPVDATYTQGDGIDSEVKGHTIRNMWCDISGDGSIDNKPTPYWVNWPAVSAFNCYLSRAKRAFRSWPGAQDKLAVAPHVLRDVVISDARQYGLFMVSTPGHHKLVDWWNPSGACNWRNPIGRTYVAVSNDGTVGGDMDAVIHQAFDARTSGTLASGMNTNTVRGGDTAPFRARLRTPITRPTPLRIQVDGLEVDDGQMLPALTGDVMHVHPVNLPAGATVDYTLAGPGTVTRSGDDAIITVDV